MAIMDPVADMFTRIRNALSVNHEIVEIPHSNMKLDICRLLKEEGYIKSFEVLKDDLCKRTIKIVLKYAKSGASVISSIVKISRPGNRVYVKKSEIPKVLNGFGISVLSTSNGILTGRQSRIKNVGGEWIGRIY